MVQFLAGERELTLLHNLQTDSGAYQTCCLMGTGDSFPGTKAAL